MQKAIILLSVILLGLLLFGCTQTATCGNKVCEVNESNSVSANYCPNDCNLTNSLGASCGDGVCNKLIEGDPSSPNFCFLDCNFDQSKLQRAVCGDGVCDIKSGGENFTECPQDCNANDAPKSAVCGDGYCDGAAGEKTTCLQDCNIEKLSEKGFCGDGYCDGAAGEKTNCLQDCSGDKFSSNGTCGDGVCNTTEDSKNCSKDCAFASVSPYCGDGLCDQKETFDPTLCPQDCNQPVNFDLVGRIAIITLNGHTPKELFDQNIKILNEAIQLDAQTLNAIVNNLEKTRLENLGYTVTYTETTGGLLSVLQQSNSKAFFEGLLSNAKNSISGQTNGAVHFSSATTYDFSTFHTYAAMKQQLINYANSYPSLAKLYDLTSTVPMGATWKGNKVYGLKISDNVATQENNELGLMVTGATHGNEWIGTEVSLYFAYYLLSNYGSSPEIKNLVDNSEIYVIPMVNPDGHILAEQRNDLFYGRKNGRDTLNPGYWDTTDGVNINRNFGYHWGQGDLAGCSSSVWINFSTDPTNNQYPGSSAFSEPESQAIRNLELSRHFDYALNYHSEGGEVVGPWGYSCAAPPDESSFSLLRSRVASFMNKEEKLYSKNQNYNYYIDTPPGYFAYLTPGDQVDYGYGEQTAKQKTFDFSVELPPTPANKIQEVDKTTMSSLLFLLSDPLQLHFNNTPSVSGRWDCVSSFNGSVSNYYSVIDQQNGASFTGVAHGNNTYTISGEVYGFKWTDTWNKVGSSYWVQDVGELSNNNNTLTLRWIDSSATTGIDTCTKASPSVGTLSYTLDPSSCNASGVCTANITESTTPSNIARIVTANGSIMACVAGNQTLSAPWIVMGTQYVFNLYKDPTGACATSVLTESNKLASTTVFVPSPTAPSCAASDWNYSDGECQSGNTLTRTWGKKNDCISGVQHSPLTESVACNYQAPTCTSFAYSDWAPSVCPSTATQTRTILSTTPAVCQGGNPEPLTKSCTYIPTCTESDWTHSDGACQSTGTLARTWTKTNTSCTGGVIHSTTETTSCNYSGLLYSFADISDLHICKVDQLAYNNSSADPSSGGISCSGGLESGITGAGGVRDLVSKINSRTPTVNTTVITGDITQYGSLLAYNNAAYFGSKYNNSATTQFLAAKAELDSLTAGYYAVAGNHDIFGGSNWSPSDYSLYFRSAFNLTQSSYVVSVNSYYQFVFLTCMNSQGGDYGANCSASELALLQNALANGKKTFVFVHFQIIPAGGNEASPYSNKTPFADVLNSPNLALIVVGHDGCSQGIYFDNMPVTYIKQYMAPHKYCNSWCGNTCNFTPYDAVPTIAYFDLYTDKIVITQQCTTANCTNPAQITIPVSIASATTGTLSHTVDSSSCVNGICTANITESTVPSNIARIVTANGSIMACVAGNQTLSASWIAVNTSYVFNLYKDPTGACATSVLTESNKLASTTVLVPSTSVPCTESDWTSSVSPVPCPSSGKQTRTWTKTNTSCVGGVTKTSPETINCTYTPPTCTTEDWNFSDGVCQSNNKLTRTWNKKTDCINGIQHSPLTESIACNYQAPTCTSFIYSDWVPSVCPSTAIQTRTILSTTPAVCQGGNSEPLTKSCTYVPTCTESDWTHSDGACQSNNKLTRTWTKINTICINGPAHFATELVDCTYTAPTCTDFNYSDWAPSVCPQSQIQTRNITSKSPANCNGGNFEALTRGCTYVPTCVDAYWDYNLTPSTCPSSGQQTKNWFKVINCVNGTQKASSEIVSCTYNAPGCIYTYSDWSECAGNVQGRTFTSSPANCQGQPDDLIKSCVSTQICTENNWSFSLGACVDGNQAKTWVKTSDCNAGVQHSSEIISCSVAIDVPEYCGSNDWTSRVEPEVCPPEGIQARLWTKTNTNCQGGLVQPVKESITCTPGSTKPIGGIPADRNNPIIIPADKNKTLCTESDWIFTLDPKHCDVTEQQIKIWEKTGDCLGGVTHKSTEIVSCKYTQTTLDMIINLINSFLNFLGFGNKNPCGNNTCETGENDSNSVNYCPNDCPNITPPITNPPTDVPPVKGTTTYTCPNRVCETTLGENSKNCPNDCTTTNPTAKSCGDGKCDTKSETITNCSSDCGIADYPAGVCGDTKCDARSETAANCPSDCANISTSSCSPDQVLCTVTQSCTGTLGEKFPQGICCNGSCSDTRTAVCPSGEVLCSIGESCDGTKGEKLPSGQCCAGSCSSGNDGTRSPAQCTTGQTLCIIGQTCDGTAGEKLTSGQCCSGTCVGN